MEGKWLSILEYANFKDKSISTVRRYIKANRVKYREENGKYYIWTKNYFNHNPTPKDEREITKLRFELERLNLKLREVQEENEELKMLVNILEDTHNKKINISNLPELPIENN